MVGREVVVPGRSDVRVVGLGLWWTGKSGSDQYDLPSARRRTAETDLGELDPREHARETRRDQGFEDWVGVPLPLVDLLGRAYERMPVGALDEEKMWVSLAIGRWIGSRRGKTHGPGGRKALRLEVNRKVTSDQGHVVSSLGESEGSRATDD